MEIFQIVAIAIIATILSIIIKSEKPELGIYIGLVTGVIIFIFILAKLKVVIEVFNGLASKTNLDDIYLTTILKIIGIAYITEFGAQICRDAGEGVIASKVEFSGKILIMVMSIPILVSLMDLIISIVP